LSVDELKLEWQNAKSIIHSLKDIHSQTGILEVFSTKYQELLPNVSKLASITAVIPVSTAGKLY
jgi:hypothetical protein